MRVGKGFLPRSRCGNLRQSVVFPAAGQKGALAGWPKVVSERLGLGLETGLLNLELDDFRFSSKN